ncbi:MAG: HAD family hydrolase [Bdellovibrionota bacterium]
MNLDRYSALLFDLDGTLANSMGLHNDSWIATLKTHGHSITAEILQEYAGIQNQRTVELFNQRFGWNLPAAQVIEEKESRFLTTIEKVKPIEVVLKIAFDNYERKPLAIVSGGHRELVIQILRTLGIFSLFPVIVCAEDSEKGKPHPDPFLKAAQQLNMDPKKCVVFEDGEAGIRGARAAGMGVVKVGQAPHFSLELLS